MTGIDWIGGPAPAPWYTRSTFAPAAPGSLLNAVQTLGNAYPRYPGLGTDSVWVCAAPSWTATGAGWMQNDPEVRQRRIDNIKQRLDEGTYHVLAQVLARQMWASARVGQHPFT
ncbi:MAG: flagellar biosynthesis anti-sigma factor FlgM [Chloroflexota bacterium]